MENQKSNTVLDSLLSKIESGKSVGSISQAQTSILRGSLSGVKIGEYVSINSHQESPLVAKVLSFQNNLYTLAPLGDSSVVSPGMDVQPLSINHGIHLSEDLCGSCVDAFGTVVEKLSPKIRTQKRFPSYYAKPEQSPPSVLDRGTSYEALSTGINAIDCFLTMAKGQRLSVLAEPGVGKSTLLHSIANSTTSDITILALNGERGREVTEWIEKLRTTEAGAKTIIVFATSDEVPMKKVVAAHTAMRLSEYFRDCGLDVLLLFDSITRWCRSYREVGTFTGELPLRQGYPASLFSELSKLIERAGATKSGSITALFTALKTKHFDEDPIVEELMSLTDGHILLSAELAEKGQYPAIDVLSSISRLQTKVLSENNIALSIKVKRLLKRIQQDKDIIVLGGAPDEELSLALEIEHKLETFLTDKNRSTEEAFNSLGAILNANNPKVGLEDQPPKNGLKL